MPLTYPTSQTLTGAQYALKVRYLGTIRKQFNESTVFFTKLAKRVEPVSGKSFTIAHHTAGNVSAGVGRGDGIALPTPGSQTIVNSIVPNSYQYSTMRITGPTIAATRDSVGAFANMLEFEVDNLLKNMKRSFNRQFHGDGRDALAFWTGADDTSGVTIDDGQGNAFVHLPTGAITCDLIDASDNATKVGDSIVVTLGAKAATNYAATFSGSVSGSADADYLVLEDTLGAQMMGLDGIVSAADPTLGALQGLAVASNPFWKAQVNSAGGTNRAFDFADLQSVIDDIASLTNYSESDIDLLLCNFPVRREYYKACIVERRHVNTMELDGGFKALDFNGIPLVADSQCKRNRIYALCMKSLALVRSSDFEWMDKDGSYLSREAGYDAYGATLFHYGNLMTYDRNANGLYTDILEG
jgi:hypothetical protein